MLSRLKTTPVRTPEDVRTFFDQFAPSYSEKHGNADRLLRYRIDLIKSTGHLRAEDVVLDIGCGPGHHLLAMGGDIARGVGIDFSSEMIKVATRRLARSFPRQDITFHLDTSEQLKTVLDGSVDVALCVGSLEHMIDQPGVLKNAYRVLKPGGRFVCLTPNRGYIWYSRIAPALKIDIRHLSTDKFLTREELLVLLNEAGFEHVSLHYWTFIPKGDMHPLAGIGLQMADAMGKFFNLKALRGGLLASARKSQGDGKSPGSFFPT